MDVFLYATCHFFISLLQQKNEKGLNTSGFVDNMDAVIDHLFNDSTCDTPSNYAELVLINAKDSETCSYDFGKDVFMDKLKHISKTCHIKYFTKKIKRYRVEDMSMEMCDDDIKIFKQTCGKSCIVNDAMLCIGYSRDKQPYHMFPCTTRIHEIVFIQRLTFRLHNRLFLNFEIQKTIDKRQIFKIYFNYNHDKCAETQVISDILTKFTQYLLASTC